MSETVQGVNGPYNWTKAGGCGSFIYTTKGGEAPSYPSKSSHCEDVYANSYSLLQGKKRHSGACNGDHSARQKRGKESQWQQ